MKFLLVILAVLSTHGCAAKVGAEYKTIPTDAARTCESQCQEMGLHMSAVAIMADTIGCVCQRGVSENANNAGATAAGMATIVGQEADKKKQEL